MSRIAYYRVSTKDQSIEAQRHTLGEGFEEEFRDEGISGSVPAEARPGFSNLMKFIRKGDSLHVVAVDRLGRDAIDIQTTVRKLLHKGVAVEIFGLGRIDAGVGELVLAVLAQVADMERKRITERTASGRALAKESLKSTGKTHRGKTSLGRPVSIDGQAISAWRQKNRASISETAKQFGISSSSVKRYSSSYGSSSTKNGEVEKFGSL